jgi:hypothetical protein
VRRFVVWRDEVGLLGGVASVKERTRHPGVGRDPETMQKKAQKHWIPDRVRNDGFE